MEDYNKPELTPAELTTPEGDETTQDINPANPIVQSDYDPINTGRIDVTDKEPGNVMEKVEGTDNTYQTAPNSDPVEVASERDLAVLGATGEDQVRTSNFTDSLQESKAQDRYRQLTSEGKPSEEAKQSVYDEAGTDAMVAEVRRRAEEKTKSIGGSKEKIKENADAEEELFRLELEAKNNERIKIADAKIDEMTAETRAKIKAIKDSKATEQTPAADMFDYTPQAPNSAEEQAEDSQE